MAMLNKWKEHEVLEKPLMNLTWLKLKLSASILFWHDIFPVFIVLKTFCVLDVLVYFSYLKIQNTKVSS